MERLRSELKIPRSAPAVPESDLLLGYLGTATTAYFEAPPERIERARQEYERALEQFKNANHGTR